MGRTKIVATIGPSSDTPDIIKRLLEAGMNVARLNFSHGDHAYHARNIATLRNVANQMNHPLAILQDLQGPKIRTGLLVDGGPVTLQTGQRFVLTTQSDIIGNAEGVSISYAALAEEVEPGDRILVSDGLIELRVLQSAGNRIETEIVRGGSLRQRQGVNLPGVKIRTPALTAKDIDDLEFGLEHGVEYIALSFVRQAADIEDLKGRIAAAGKQTPVIAKIEKPEALEHFGAILQVTDGVMIARGDLGVEISPELVPSIQKQLIRAANVACVPVITATQMLESMINQPQPTRAETSDVANAILDGTDAVMLSGETAAGHFPVDSVQTMHRIAEMAEQHGWQYMAQDRAKLDIGQQRTVPRAISAAARALVDAVDVQAIVAFTMSGNTARLLSHQRPMIPIIAITPSEDVWRRLSLLWGVTAMRSPFLETDEALNAHIQHLMAETGLASAGDLVVVVGGHPTGAAMPTNVVRVLQIESS
ncbi:MAG: pyruvate kinase [Chloroflexaceae bacterium]|nr:pyruvate kinase [Chloroflexaceae bacterium]